MSRPKQRKGGRVTPKGAATASSRRAVGRGAGSVGDAQDAPTDEPLFGPLSGSWSDDPADPSDEPDLLARTGDAIAGGHPAGLLVLASALAEEAAGVERSRQGDVDPGPGAGAGPEGDEPDGGSLGWSDVLGGCIDAVRPETTALLYALRPFAPDHSGKEIAAALARRSTPSLPAWIAEIGEAAVTGVWRRHDVPGGGEDVLVGVRWPTGQELTLIVHVEHRTAAVVEDVLPMPTDVEAVVRAAVADDSSATFEQVEPADARALLEPAARRSGASEHDPGGDDWPALRPLLLWLLSTMPVGALVPEGFAGPLVEPSVPTAAPDETDAAVAERADCLPIGEEPVEVSVRWARMDAERRGVALGRALDDRISAHADLADHLDAWDATITEIDDGDGFRDAVEVAADAGVTFALLTACNPMTVELSEEENDRRNRSLLDECRPPLRSIGRSVDGSWSEVGFAMPMGPEAIDAAQHFGQAAIFVASPTGRTVLVLVGAPPDELDRAGGAPA